MTLSIFQQDEEVGSE